MDPFQRETAAAAAVREAVGPFTRAILAVTPQGKFAVSVDDMYVGRSLCHTGQYAPGELNQLRTMCNAQTRLLVLGAHIGAICIPLATTCHSVVAIEANPATFELLQFNVGLNGLKNCRVIHKAASNKTEQIEFVMSRTNSGGSKRLPVIRHANYFYDNPQVVKVDAAPVDELLPGETFDVILIDIEGSEYFALQGMQRILSTASVLQIEFLPHHLRNVAGVSIEDFVAQIAPHFASMIITGKKVLVGRDQFLPVLKGMFEADEGDAGIHFLKAPPENVHFS